MFSFTPVIVVLTCLISFLAFSNYKLKEMLIFWPPAVSMRHQYYRFITCGLIHADFLHLFMNMFSLYFFGRGAELLYRGELGLQAWYYPILYISALIIANIPSYLRHRDDYNYRSLGASGAVCAVIFAVILIRPWDPVYLFGALKMPSIVFALVFLVYSIYMSRRGGDNVNHDAHLWGSLYGIVFTIAVHPGIVSTFFNEISQPRF